MARLRPRIEICPGCLARHPSATGALCLDDGHLARGESKSPLPEQVDFLYLLPQATPGVERASFAASAWQGSSGSMMQKTVQGLVDGVRTDNISSCRMPTAPTAIFRPPVAGRISRAGGAPYRSSQAGALRSLRSLKVPRD